VGIYKREENEAIAWVLKNISQDLLYYLKSNKEPGQWNKNTTFLFYKEIKAKVVSLYKKILEDMGKRDISLLETRKIIRIFLFLYSTVYHHLQGVYASPSTYSSFKTAFACPSTKTVLTSCILICLPQEPQ